MKFSERLKKAADKAGVEWGQTALGTALGVSKQTAERWMGEGEPKPAQLFRIADRLKVDARWLATEEGEMVPKASAAPGLEKPERELLQGYREADPRWQFCLLLLARVASEEQIQAASDVTMVMARIFGEKYKVTGSKRVRQVVGDAPHVAARKENALKEKR